MRGFRIGFSILVVALILLVFLGMRRKRSMGGIT